MNKRLLTLFISLSLCGAASAENLLDIYQQAQEKDPQLLEAKAQRDAAVAEEQAAAKAAA